MFPLLPSGSGVESELFRCEGQNPRGGQSQYSQARYACDSHSRDPSFVKYWTIGLQSLLHAFAVPPVATKRSDGEQALIGQTYE